MLSSIYIFKAMRSYCSTGDFCSASRFSTRREPRALAPTELPRRSGRLCHLIPAMRKDKPALFSVLLVFISMVAMSQSEVRVWRVILTPCFTFQMKITVSFGGLYGQTEYNFQVIGLVHDSSKMVLILISCLILMYLKKNMNILVYFYM